MIHRLTDKEKVDIIEGYNVKLIPMIALAKMYGVSRQAVHKALRLAGIETSTQGAGNIEVSCTVCGKGVIKHRCLIRKFKHHFCGDECYHAWLEHGNGNPLVVHRHSGRIARAVVSRLFDLHGGHIVHHEDRNQYNNAPYNLRVFANQGDHVKYHRDCGGPVLWDGRIINKKWLTTDAQAQRSPGKTPHSMA